MASKTTNKQKVLRYVRHSPYCLAKDIAKDTGVTYSYTRVLLAALKSEGKVDSDYCQHDPKCKSYFQKIKKPHEYWACE